MAVFKKGRHWYIDYYVKGVRKRKKIGPSKHVAELALKDVELKLARGEYLGIYAEKKLTFRQFTPEYLAYSQANKAPGSYRRDQGIIDTRLMPFFGEQYLSEITLARTEQYKAQRLTLVDPATVNKELNCLKALLNKAVAWKHLKTHPLAGMRLLKEPPGRLRYLTPEEKDRLLDACAEPPYLQPIVELAIHTGMRRGNIVKLRWPDIDLKRRMILLSKTKNNERHAIPMNETVAAVLHATPHHLGSDLLFPGVNGNMVTMAFQRACRRAGLTDLRFHDLRHTFGSHLAMEGFNLRTIQQLLGHKDLRMTMRYAHLSAEHLQQAVNRLDVVMGEPAKQRKPHQQSQ
jgi:integrase